MSTSSILDTLQLYKDHIEAQGYFVYAIMLKGSQNYNLSERGRSSRTQLTYCK